MKSPLEDVNPAVRPTEGQIALSEPLISSPYWPGTWNYRTGKYNDQQEKLPFRFWVFEDLGFEHLNCQTGKENYVKSLVDLHKDIRLISPCGGGEDKRCVESTVWKCGSVEVWKRGQEQDFPLWSASITSPPKTALPPLSLKISKANDLLGGRDKNQKKIRLLKACINHCLASVPSISPLASQCKTPLLWFLSK